MSRRRKCAIQVGLPCLLAVMLPALTEAAKKKTFEDETTVLEVAVPVHVLGRDGQPIRGLTRDDFEIVDQGKKQEITGFEVIDLDVVAPGGSRTEVDRAVPAAARRHFLFLFDLSFSRPGTITRAREAAREFALRSLHPTDLAAVAIHSIDQGSQLLVTFTPDRAQVARAIDTMGAPSLLDLAQRDPLRFLIDDPARSSVASSLDLPPATTTGGGPAGNFASQAANAHTAVVVNQIERMERSYERGRISSWSTSLGELARMMDSIKGRKQVIYFSEGFDGTLVLGRQPDGQDQELQNDLNNIQQGNFFLVDTDQFYGNANVQNELARMLEEFRRADCVIQAVDISGLRADSTAEQRLQRVGQDALFYIANETGGELYKDANKLGPELEKVMERSSVTYLLRFQPEIVADGSYHRLKVRAKTEGKARVAYRKGYYAPRPFNELHPMEKSLLAADAIASIERKDELEVSVLAAPFRATEADAYVPVIIEMAGPSLLVDHDDEDLPVEVYAYVTNRDGEMRDFFSQMVTVNLGEGRRKAFRQTGLKYYGHLDLGPGDYLIRVLVRNASTGRTGLEAARLSIPAYAEDQPYVLPPFFVEDPGSWFLVKESRDAYQKSVVYPFTVNGQPYVPAARPSITKKEAAQLCLVAYNFGTGELRVESEIQNEHGEAVPGGSLALVERTVTGIDGLDKLLATFRPDGLAPGNYNLRIAVTDPETGSTQMNRVPFTLVN